ncbi:MAG: 6-phosphogluconate dehydrogenase [Flavobacteriales bacterium]|nr:6-phosphogluconate dehydrogenase [Flavobacteriales bacterium]
MLFIYYASYSTGVRAGVVVKVSRAGVVFKTWEGQLNLQSFGAVQSTPNQLNEIFNFSVERGDKQVIEELQEASLSGERVNLHYVERYARLPWRGSTSYFVTAVERSGNVQDPRQSPYSH